MARLAVEKEKDKRQVWLPTKTAGWRKAARLVENVKELKAKLAG